MSNFEITIRPTDWGWRWEMTWYDPKSPLSTAFKNGKDPYPTREDAKKAAEDYARRISERVPVSYVYDPRSPR